MRLSWGVVAFFSTSSVAALPQFDFGSGFRNPFGNGDSSPSAKTTQVARITARDSSYHDPPDDYGGYDATRDHGGYGDYRGQDEHRGYGGYDENRGHNGYGGQDEDRGHGRQPGHDKNPGYDEHRGYDGYGHEDSKPTGQGTQTSTSKPHVSNPQSIIPISVTAHDGSYSSCLLVPPRLIHSQ